MYYSLLHDLPSVKSLEFYVPYKGVYQVFSDSNHWPS